MVRRKYSGLLDLKKACFKAAAGINATLFLANGGLFLSGLLRDKVYSPNRRYNKAYKYGSQI